MPTRKIYELVLDSDGHIIYDTFGNTIMRLVKTEEFEETPPIEVPVVYSLGELEQDPSSMVLNTSWVLVQGGTKIWKKYTKEGIEEAVC